MLITITGPGELDAEKLMEIYRESNEENAQFFYPETERAEALERVKRDFVEYIKSGFLTGLNRYFVWEQDGVWVSALRLTFVREGLYYLEALETRPDRRLLGYGARVLREALMTLEGRGSFEVRDCVGKKNAASLATHFKCGFVIDSDAGVDCLNGERDERTYGMKYAGGGDRNHSRIDLREGGFYDT